VAYLDRKICPEVVALTYDHRHIASGDRHHRLRRHRHLGNTATSTRTVIIEAANSAGQKEKPPLTVRASGGFDVRCTRKQLKQAESIELMNH
jgi:hypothetical protein